MAPDEGYDSPYSPPVDPGIVRAIYDYYGRWPIPEHDGTEDDYSEESFA